MRLRQLSSVLAAAVLIHLPSSAQACAVCLGGSDSNVRGALNGAIFLMLGVLGTVLALITAVGVSIFRRSHKE